MSRKKDREKSQRRFVLYLDDPKDADLNNYLLELSETDDATLWIKAVLYRAIPASKKSSGGISSTSSAKPNNSARLEIVDDVQYEDIDE